MIKSKEYYDNLKKFKKAEIETIKNKIFVDKNIIIPEDNFSPFDFIYEDKKCIVELKNRNFTSEFFDNKYEGEMLLEKQKASRLLNLVKKGGKYEGYLACYMYYFTDNVFQYVILNYIDFNKMNEMGVNTPVNSCEVNAARQTETCYKIPKELLNSKNSVRRKLLV